MTNSRGLARRQVQALERPLYAGPRGADPGRGFVVLKRRGVNFGHARELHRETPPLLEVVNLWGAGAPVVLRRAAVPFVKVHAQDIGATVKMFTAVRGGSGFRDEMARRLLAHPEFRLAGSTVDVADGREIEKVHADLRDVKSGRVAARDLYAKLSWISHDKRDRSLRIRFSFGSERLRDWRGDVKRAVAADRYAEVAFPECAAIARNELIHVLVASLTGGRVRFSERILYSNAPNGGAAFHHDGETCQRGVAYAQLAGETGWLALRKRDLAEFIGRRMRRESRRVLQALDAHGDTAMDRLLTSSVPLVRDLVNAGHFYRLRPGDILLLPSHGPDDVAWHSVFATGVKPSLSLSFAIFGENRGRI